MIGSATLDCQRNDFSGFFVGVFLGLMLEVFDQNSHFMAGLLFYVCQQNRFCFFLGQACQALEFCHLFVIQLIDLLLL